jgi:signal transduction histidine kinase
MEVEALADLARQGLRQRDLSELLSLLARHTAVLLAADYSIVNEVDDQANVRHRGSFGEIDPAPLGPLSRTGIGAAVLKAGKTLVLTQGNARGRSRLARSPTHSRQGAWALLAAPIPSHEGLRGVLHAAWRRPVRPGPEEVRLIETLAAFGGGMIDSLYGRDLAERRERAVQRQLALAAISEALDDASRDMQKALEVIVRETSRVLDATCAIRLLSEDGQHIQGGAVYDANPEFRAALAQAMTSVAVPLATSHYRAVVLEGKPSRWFDASGRRKAQTLPPPVRGALNKLPLFASLVAPIRAYGKVLGTIGLYKHDQARPFSDADERFLVDVGDRVGPVLENARLFEELSASRARLEALSQRLVAVHDQERRAIALELHDEISQSLTAARLLIEAARRLPARLRDERLEEAGRTLDEAIAQVRGLTLDLRPPMLDRFGLGPALAAYFERYRNRTGVRVDFQDALLPARPAADVEIAAYRILQEGLTNVARYAGVDQVRARLWARDGQLNVELVDAGAGFDPSVLRDGSSAGLTGMQERAEALGGQLLVESAPGQGTRLLARLPLRPLASRSTPTVR